MEKLLKDISDIVSDEVYQSDNKLMPSFSKEEAYEIIKKQMDILQLKTGNIKASFNLYSDRIKENDNDISIKNSLVHISESALACAVECCIASAMTAREILIIKGELAK